MSYGFRVKSLSFGFSLTSLLIVSAYAQVLKPGVTAGRDDQAATSRAVPSASAKLAIDTMGATRKTIGERGKNRRYTGDIETPLFLSQVSYPAGTSTGATAFGDVNGDGKLDLVVATSAGTPAIGVLLGNGDGTFGPVSIYSGGHSSDGPIALGDVNGDGKLDVIIENQCAAGDNQCGGTLAADGQVGVLLGNGDGTFQAPVFYDAGGEGTASVTVADVNRDGKLDLITVNCDSRNNGNNRVGVLLGKGDGTFEPAVTYSSGGHGYETGETVVVDVNGDGIPDILVADINGDISPSNGQLGVLLGNGDGTFQSAVVYDAGAPNTIGLAVADLNGDGNWDVVMASCAFWACANGAVDVLLGNGDGTFQPAVLYLTGASPAVAIFDADRDGKLDIVAVVDGGVQVMLGNGDGTFSPNAFFPVTPGAISLAVADLNGDHAPDLALATYSGTVAVLLANARALTSTSVTSSLNPAVYGQTIVFRATVTSSAGTPTGNVIFYDGTNTLGTVALSGGSAALTISIVGAGTQSITAAYQGSGQFNISNSAALNEVVKAATTATSLTSSLDPVNVNQLVTYTSRVTSQYGGNAAGTITFTDDSATVAIVTLAGNQATYRTKYGSFGSHTITAIYSGDGSNTASASLAIAEKVVSPTKTTVTTSNTPSHVGQPVTFTATVVGKFGVVPSGELVTFSDGKKLLASVPLTSGVAAYTTSSLSAKTHTIIVHYPGDSNFTLSQGNVKQVVTP